METLLGHKFKDKTLLNTALTHSSFHPVFNYERLEFLGDRVLNLCIAQILYKNFAQKTEGELAKHHAALVKETTLAYIAKQIGIGKHIIFGPSEVSSKGHEKPSILADVIESFIGALYLDAGLEKTIKFVEIYWVPLLKSVQIQDAKTRLQELLQAQGLSLPSYIVVNEEGKDNNKIFTISVSSSLGNAEGKGSSKQIASQMAAEILLSKIEKSV